MIVSIAKANHLKQASTDELSLTLKSMGSDHEKVCSAEHEGMLHYLLMGKTMNGAESKTINTRKGIYDSFHPTVKKLLGALYDLSSLKISNRDKYAYSDFEDSRKVIERACTTFNGAFENEKSAHLVLKMLGVDYLDPMYDPVIAAHDRILNVLGDSNLLAAYSSNGRNYY